MRTAIVFGVVLMGCQPTEVVKWDCPSEWIAAPGGGCAPQVLVCSDPQQRDRTECAPALAAHTVVSSDGGMGKGFYLGPDGGIQGPWATAGAANGPPAFTATPPTVGIPAAMCPMGWSARADNACEPNVATQCGAGAEGLPGGVCTHTSVTDCPTTDFPAVPAGATRVVYVRQGATGDGSEMSPMGSIASAVQSAGADGWVLVAAGTYTESLQIDGTAKILGVCAARVTLRASPMLDAVRVGPTTGNLTLSGMTIEAENGRGIDVGNGAHATLSRIRVARSFGSGIAIHENSDATVDDVVVVAPMTLADGSNGHGIELLGARNTTLRRVVIAGATDMGILDTTGTGNVVEDSVVRDVRRVMNNGVAPDGLTIGGGSVLTVRRSVVQDCQGNGVLATDSGSVANLDFVVIRRTGMPPGGSAGTGLNTAGGGRFVATHTWVSEAAGFGVSVSSTGNELNDSIVTDTRGGGGNTGYGIDASPGGGITVRRTRVDRARLGVRALGPNSTVKTEDCIIAHAANNLAFDGGGSGVLAVRDTVVDLVRTWVIENRQWGVISDGGMTMARARVTVTDSVVARNGLSSTLSCGGVLAVRAGRATVTRTLIDENADRSAQAQLNGAQLEIVDSVVSRGKSRADGEVSAVGVLATDGCTVQVRGTSIEQNEEVGAGATGAAAVLRMTESRVVATTARPDGRLGVGMIADGAAAMELERVLVQESLQNGILLFNATLAAHDVVLDNVKPSPAGLGVGVFATYGSNVTADRLAIRGSAGAGLVLSDRVLGTQMEPIGSTLVLQDFYTESIRSSTVGLRLDAAGYALRDGKSVAYGLQVGRGSNAEIVNATLTGGGYGVFVAPTGRASLRTGTIRGQLDAVGATSGDGVLELIGVSQVENARNAVVKDETLPEAAALPPPTPVCPETGCL